MNISFTVFFDDPFWVGVLERYEEGWVETCRVVFGAEPRDIEVYSYILKNYYSLRFSRPVFAEKRLEKKPNPKKLQREIKLEINGKGVGTRAQQAIKLEYESRKEEYKKYSKIKRKEEQQEKFELRQEKKKQKKKGH